MVQAINTAQSVDSNARRYRRFNLRYPVLVSFYDHGFRSQVDTVSENVSIGGLLLASASPIPTSTPVSFVITVTGPSAVRPIVLSGEGQVVRVGGLDTRSGYSIAIRCKAPLTQLVAAQG